MTRIVNLLSYVMLVPANKVCYFRIGTYLGEKIGYTPTKRDSVIFREGSAGLPYVPPATSRCK